MMASTRLRHNNSRLPTSLIGRHLNCVAPAGISSATNDRYCGQSGARAGHRGGRGPREHETQHGQANSYSLLCGPPRNAREMK
jgi:hypothetical protein